MTSARIAVLSALIAFAVLCGLGLGVASASRTSTHTTPTELWSCANRPVLKPKTFTITCADGYTLLTSTHWTSWAINSAAGRTTFGMNLCDPYCAASKISYFPKSVVRLSDPESTHHGKLFAKLTVTYKLHGKKKTFRFSWSGDPSFTGS